MNKGFFRVAACSPAVSVANVGANVDNIVKLVHEASKSGADLIVFPELSVTGYTCGDLFHNASLLKEVKQGIERIAMECDETMPLVIVGAPIEKGGILYNCAVALRHGAIVGIVPKTYLPTYNEFYERRWFAPYTQSSCDDVMETNDAFCGVPFSSKIMFEVGGVNIGVEICEDLWVPIPPSCNLAMQGAQIIANLSASNDIIGKYQYLKSLLKQQSARCICGYVYASAGFGESTTDSVFDGKTIICENGKVLAEGNRYTPGNKMVVSDIDIKAINRDRMHLSTFADCAATNKTKLLKIDTYVDGAADTNQELLREVNPLPFVPSTSKHLAERCEEIIHLQSTGLRQRLSATHTNKLVIGISGGLDSTLALLVAVRAFDELGLDRSGIVGITMPGFGTSGRTLDNALTLMRALGITMREISIVAAVEQHFKDINHDKSVHDVTYENSQARERTQILMDVANQVGGMVLGTGDLSELALGWATYNGDHMSMYGVNAGVPKTLVRHLVRYFATQIDNIEARKALLDIVDTPISPELIPADEQGNITQKTEDLVGPYELHDFFLYYMLRYGFSPSRIYLLASKAFKDKFDDATIRKWLRTFFRRFFSQQFKRSCLPDGPKIGSVSLSPRGDWRMPSDASAAIWLRECDEL